MELRINRVRINRARPVFEKKGKRMDFTFGGSMSHATIHSPCCEFKYTENYDVIAPIFKYPENYEVMNIE